MSPQEKHKAPADADDRNPFQCQRDELVTMDMHDCDLCGQPCASPVYTVGLLYGGQAKPQRRCVPTACRGSDSNRSCQSRSPNTATTNDGQHDKKGTSMCANTTENKNAKNDGRDPLRKLLDWLCAEGKKARASLANPTGDPWDEYVSFGRLQAIADAIDRGEEILGIVDASFTRTPRTTESEENETSRTEKHGMIPVEKLWRLIADLKSAVTELKAEEKLFGNDDRRKENAIGGIAMARTVIDRLDTMIFGETPQHHGKAEAE